LLCYTRRVMLGLDSDQPQTDDPQQRATAMRRVGLWVVVATCVVVLFVALLPQLNKASELKYTGPVEDISTGLIGEYAALILIAQDQGYFKEYGLDVTITEYVSGPEALTALFEGKVDTAMGSDFAGVRNSFNGEDLKIIGTLSKSEAFFVISRKDRGIERMSDLVGKKVGITRKTVGEFYLGQFLTLNNVPQADITTVDMPQAELVEALAEGKIDSAVLFEPNAYKALNRLGDQAINWSVQSGQSIYSLLYSTGTFVKANAPAIERYMKAVVAAEQFVKAENEKARQIVAARLGYDEAYINYIWPRFVFETSLEQELLLNMDDEARWAIANKLTTATTQPNYLRMLHLGGLQAAKPEAITIVR
jgi:NitT/TauT family transport system substrate-binding protein